VSRAAANAALVEVILVNVVLILVVFIPYLRPWCFPYNVFIGMHTM